MFSIVFLLPVIGVILFAVIFLFGFVSSNNEEYTDATDTEQQIDNEVIDEPPETEPQRFHIQPHVPPPTRGSATVIVNERDFTQRHPQETERFQTQRPQQETERFQRPVTPIQSNHYRPITPIHHRPVTPVIEQQPQQTDRVWSPVNAAGQQHQQSRNVSDPEKDFKTYQDLTEEEKIEIVNLNQCYVDVERSNLDPLLALINAKGDGRPVQFVVGQFDKSSDKQLSPSERFVRRSFKIKNRQSNTSRFARLRIINSDARYYRLMFHDYTPYLANHAPRFDVFRQEVNKDRCRWEEVGIYLYYNTKSINIKHMRILVPVSKTN